MMSTTTLCDRCGTSPRGIDGHAGLESLVGPKGSGLTFKCVECQTRWSRRYSGSGHFEWRLERLEAAE